ncbi:hypothetical protein SPRG_08083 [Saprolegnia parasitica CBS 223.65]|uniref:Nuclear control of ATPase protein 2 n=1 Tax=Saprolegnia parasitica (strain CBS 223.65) TaxID=695850 RepID=A0A067C8H6_SAPPC|nr:hypothetical protein SPRG_08083 [Saprolegnia parasitica CBS 223.65]KDO26793.1 hypothetical protein SPRG_08083 [Saprolegnia parasitica CBS 223.65]|eukprot:XP_012202441.1 hypothetical protein SPRG_08083 [Saprolegnia parasitica CBS 223.65]
MPFSDRRHPAGIQLQVRRQLRAVEHAASADDDNAIALELLDTMHKLAQHSVTLADVARCHARVNEHATTSSSAHAAFEAALLELTGDVALKHLQDALQHLLRVGAFVPVALRYWKRQMKQPLHLALLTAPDKLWQPTDIVPTEEKIRALEESYDQHLTSIGLLKQLLLALQHADARRYQILVHQSYRVLQHVYATSSLVKPQTEASLMAPPPAKHVVTLESLPRDVVSTAVLLEYLEELPTTQAMYTTALNETLRPCQIPHFLRRRWWQLSLAGLGALAGASYLVKNRQALGQWMQTVQNAVREFVVDHLVTPLSAIVGEVILNKKACIQDPRALEDSRESLQRMLADFIRDTDPSLPPSQQLALAQAMDMSVVSLQFEKELPRALKNIVTGDIVRMMLIQVHSIYQKELMVAMKAIDELMDANQLNLQMMATVPMFLVAGGVYALVSRLSSTFLRFTSARIYDDPATVATTMRYTLRDIERLLNMQNTTAAPGHGASLGVRDLGLLVVLLNDLRSLYDRNRGYFDEDEQKRFEEDLSDLVGDQMLVAQQLAVIQRMHHSHSFLMVQDVHAKWFQ